MSDNARNLLNGTAWHEFCDRLKATGDRIIGEGYPTEERDRAEGYRYLTRLLSYSLRMEVEAGDPAFPVMCRYEEPHTQWGGPNPDNTYLRATVSAEHDYRVWGNVKDMRQAIFSLQEGDMQMEQYGVYSEQSLDDYVLGPDGEFELWVSREPRPGNWMPMHDDAHFFQIRIYNSDWIHDASPAIFIERVGAEGVPPPPVEAGNLADSLERAVHWVEKSAVYWNNYTQAAWKHATPNTVNPAKSTPGGADNILYGTCFWQLEKDEAIVLECDKPQAQYWNFCIHTIAWLESGDFANRQVSLSGHQIHVDSDGRIRVVLSAQDPGVPNWIDTEERERGLLVFRWVWASSNPCPEARVIKVDKVRELMPVDHPAVDKPARCRQLASRREQLWQRYI